MCVNISECEPESECDGVIVPIGDADTRVADTEPESDTITICDVIHIAVIFSVSVCHPVDFTVQRGLLPGAGVQLYGWN